MKQLVAEAIRSAHKAASLHALPNRVAVYFHELERHQWTKFRECIAYFKNEGFRLCTIDEYVASDGNEKLLFVSFDDNHACWHDALPLFDELGVRATFYINTYPIRGVASASEIERYFDVIRYDGARTTLSADDIRDLLAAGHTIGSHGHTHACLASLTFDAARAEMKISKRVLEDVLGEEVLHFAFPYGMRRNFTPKLRAACIAMGFKSIAAAIPGRMHDMPLDAVHLQRNRWQMHQSLSRNIEDIRIDGRWFERLTGRSAVG